MPKDTDADLEGSDDVADIDADPKKPASPAPNEDYKARFNGANRIVNRQAKRIQELEASFDATIADYEAKLSSAKQGSSTVEAATKELTTQLKAIEKERDSLKAAVEVQSVRDQEKKLIKEKYAALADLHDSGDLRSIKEFTGDTAQADFEAYLGRLAAKFVAPATDTPPPPPPPVDPDEILRRYGGLSPTAPAQTLPVGNKARPANVISAEMETLDPRIPEQSKKYEVLLNELNQALG